MVNNSQTSILVNHTIISWLIDDFALQIQKSFIIWLGKNFPITDCMYKYISKCTMTNYFVNYIPNESIITA